ncbi:MAG: DUF6498-containing protein [Patescibacteria group bacterium]|nr:DUF6498-containing protein [Patescibacteria group bacterium]
MFLNHKRQKSLFSDPSLWFLLLSNFVTIFLATKENWNLSTIMWIYLFQSITIGFFNFIRILQLKNFSVKGFKINGRSVQATQSTKIFTAFFFLFHYGFFHFGYSIFLLSGIFAKTNLNHSSVFGFKYIFLASALFFINHLFSYFYNNSKETKKQNIGSLMVYPYARIIPMHLTVIFGSFLINALPLFLVLKTFADCIMHSIEHNVIRKTKEQ